MRKILKLFIVGASALVLVAALAPGAEAASSGRLMVFANPDFSGSTNALTYTRCLSVRRQLGVAGSFDNQPMVGCQAVLRDGQGASLVLCAGRGVVPPAFHQSPLLVIQPGISPPCPTTP